MFKRKCVVKYVDDFGIEHAAKVEAESLFEAAVRRLHRLDSSFRTEENVGTGCALRSRFTKSQRRTR
jgi:hypothetical protein